LEVRLNRYSQRDFGLIDIVTNPNTQLLIVRTSMAVISKLLYKEQNGFLNIFNFIVAIIAGLLCDRLGRRPLFLASTIGEVLDYHKASI
jgi:MFS family permease